MQTLLDDDQDQLDKGTPYDPSASSWQTNVGEPSTDDFADLNELPTASDDDLPEGHPSRSNKDKSVDSDGLNKAEDGVADGKSSGGKTLPKEDGLGGEAWRVGNDLGKAIASNATPMGYLQRARAVISSRKGRSAGIGGIILTILFIFFAISAGSLDTEHYKNNFLTNANKSANRVLQKRKLKNDLKALNNVKDKLEKQVAENKLRGEGLEVKEDANGDVNSVRNTAPDGTTAEIDPTGNVADQVDAIEARSATLLDDTINKIEPTEQLLGEDLRGDAATSWMSRFKISLANMFDRAPSDPNATDEKIVQDDVAHSNDYLNEKADVSSQTGIKDPNASSDGKTTTTPDGALEAAKADEAATLGNITNPNVSAIDSAAEAVDNPASLAEQIAKPAPEELAKLAEEEGVGLADVAILGQQACKVKGALDNVNHIRRYAYAIELMRFGMKWLAFADSRKAGYSSGKANALMELWMHRPNATTGRSFGSGGAMANAFGDKTVHASSATLGKYSMGYASAGILAEISSYLRPYTGFCKVANNTLLNIGATAVGIATLIFAPEVSLAKAAAEAAPLLALIIAQDVVTKIATPILIAAGAHMVMSGLETGDVLEAAVTSGILGSLHGINNAKGLMPVTAAVHYGLDYDAGQAQKRQLASASFYDRYFNLQNENSLLGRTAVNVASAILTVKSSGVTGYAASIGRGTTQKIARAVFPMTYAATDTTSLCQDEWLNKNNIATSDWCNTYNERTPSLDAMETKQLLLNHQDINEDGSPKSQEFLKYISQCASGGPDPLRVNSIGGSGGDNEETTLCVDHGAVLAGETKTLAEAYSMDGLVKPTLAWWQKAIGNSAYAAPADTTSSGYVGINDRFASWIGYLDDESDFRQTVSGKFDTNTNGASTSTDGSQGSPADNPTNLVSGDTTNIPCAAGTNSRTDDGYKDGKLYRIRLCTIDHFEVNSQVSKQFNDMVAAAAKAGMSFVASGFSGGFRTLQGQINIYTNWCTADGITPTPPPYPKPPGVSVQCPGGAPPGYSNHQMGYAVDLGCDGQPIPRQYVFAAKNRCFLWLQQNASAYGFYEFGKGKDSSRAWGGYEGWHWSVDGN